VDPVVEHLLRELTAGLNHLEPEAGSTERIRLLEQRLATTTAQLGIAQRELAVLQQRGGGSGDVSVDPNGALDADPLAVRVDGVSVIINGSNELEAPGAAGGITQLTGDVTAGPGSGSEVATLSNTGVAAGTYGNATNVGQFTVDSKGRLTAAANVSVSSGGGGGPVNTEVLTVSGTYTVPGSVSRIRVTLVGAGGGGGGADSTGTAGGGGGGAIVIKTYDVSPSDAFDYTIGALGAGGAAGNNEGTDGGDTTWDDAGTPITAGGGDGGNSQAGGGTYASVGGGTGGTPSGGDINIRGPLAQRAFRLSATQAVPSNGANHPFGPGGDAGQAAGTDGGDAPADSFGAGGGGATAFGGTDQAGGDGAPGVIIVEEYT
jgi:hypothetical protein